MGEVLPVLERLKGGSLRGGGRGPSAEAEVGGLRARLLDSVKEVWIGVIVAWLFAFWETSEERGRYRLYLLALSNSEGAGLFMAALSVWSIAEDDIAFGREGT